ncbi:MAG: mycothiol synthase [Micrococcus sp.]|nr:mycothiol synthase [Micrococcus sp.]
MTELPAAQPHPHRDVDDALLAAIRRVLDAAQRHDGHPPFSDQTRLQLARGETALLITTGDPVLGVVAGVIEGESTVIELVVHPEHRRRGHGAALAAAAATAWNEAAATTTPLPQPAVWAHGSLPGAAQLATAHGLRPVRDLRRMRLDAEGLAALPGTGPHDVDLPAGTRLRTFRPGPDDAAWLELNAAAFADHPEQGSLTQQDLDDRTAESWFDAEGLLLVEEASGDSGDHGGHAGHGGAAEPGLLGYHWTKVATPTQGEVYAVGISPAAQGRGLGRALTLAGLLHLRQVGVDEVTLYVDGENTAAVALYEKLGFTLDASDTQYRA